MALKHHSHPRTCAFPEVGERSTAVSRLNCCKKNWLACNSPPVTLGSQLEASDGINPKGYPAGSESPSGFYPSLSWSHYRALMRVENNAARQFYETEAVQSNWSRRDLERQIGSLFYERLLASSDKTAMLEGVRQEVMPLNPLDMLKDPYVLEFLDLPIVPQLQESQLEQAIIDKLQHFLLELGRGFSFVARQKRMAAGRIEPSIPSKPTSRLQRYRLKL